MSDELLETLNSLEEIYENLSEEEFLAYYISNNAYVLSNSKYSYLEYNQYAVFPENIVVAERKLNKKDPQGNHLLKIRVNDNETILRRTLDIIYDSFSYENAPDLKELAIDSEFINNNLVIDFLRRCYNEGLIERIRIIGNDYTLTEETYNKLSFLDRISVNNSDINSNNISIESPRYKMIRGTNSDKNMEEDFVILSEMSDKELQSIVNSINNFKNPSSIKIDLRFYNPALAVSIIEKLEEYGLNKDVGIKMLGYTLTENSDEYRNLIPIANNRNIEVAYVCCHDLLGEYTNEPYVIENFYDSELEPSGKTDLQTYLKILEFVENFEQGVEGIDSNIEKIMTAYKYLNDNYYYDVDAGDTKEYGNTRDLDKILDTDQIVCTGYANLLCIMCRRVGIPMFTYDAPNHSANIARVQEKDKNGNIIFDKICTFDPTNDSGFYTRDIFDEIKQVQNKNSYTFFGLDPEVTLHNRKDNNISYITLANALSIHQNNLVEYSPLSASPYFGCYYTSYTPLTYMYSMLHLMGYNYEEDTQMYDVISELQDKGRIGAIPTELIKRASESIERRNNSNLTPEELKTHINEVESQIESSINERYLYYDLTKPARINLNKYKKLTGQNRIEEVNTYSEYIPNYNTVGIESIDMGPVYYQEIDNLNTGVNNNPTNDTTVEEPEITHDTEPVEESIPNTLEQTPQEIEEPTDDIDTIVPSEPDSIINNNSTDSIDLNNILNTVGITINGDVHIDGNVNIIFGQDTNNLSSISIAGTTIRRPKPQQETETREEYIERLDSYYEEYLPQAMEESNTTYRLTKDQIGQDLPIYSLEEQVFNATGMTDEEIEESRNKLS